MLMNKETTDNDRLSGNSLKIPANVENLDQVLLFVDSYLEESGCSLKTQMQIDVAVEELFVNIAHYAYVPGSGEAEISIWVEDEPKTVVIRFRDSGIPYNPLAKEDPDVTLSAEERQIGGLGIFMVKKSMDDIQYQRDAGQNILTIKKNL